MKKQMNLMTIVALSGLVCSVRSCYKATVVATDHNVAIYETEGEWPDFERRFKEHWKLYIKTGIYVGITAGSIIGMRNYSLSTYDDLLTKIIALESNYAAYKDRVAEHYGRDVADAIELEIEGEYIGSYKKRDPNNIVLVDPVLKVPIETTMEDYLNARYEVNRLYATQYYSSLYDFYKLLDVPDGYLNEAFMKSKNLAQYLGNDWIDIDIIPDHDKAGREYFNLVYTFKPFPGLYKEDIECSH